ncbi:Uu.00g033680.m01.CDS01 [Anthostomella pinea]|uniref:Uu.00g033680.m01.CDS01 n=1 Tax=Anthostomella pinea TaxID=933095 RepID=A0AAI8V9X1_9PEZI|nr:Uu.00g033680.m01.CDS01 [Anthostomella pinea]
MQHQATEMQNLEEIANHLHTALVPLCASFCQTHAARTGTSTNAQELRAEHTWLTQLILHEVIFAAFSFSGDEAVREQRKELVASAQALLAYLDTKLPTAALAADEEAKEVARKATETWGWIDGWVMPPTPGEWPVEK